MMENIVLTGFMGTGKSITGKAIAEKLKFAFIDTDSLIEEKTNSLINDIFKNFGEEYFRSIETEIIKSVSENVQNSVISTGGGAVLNKDNIAYLRKNGIVFNLYGSIDVILGYLGKDGDSRPVINGKTKEQVEDILKARQEFYDNCDYKIVIDGKSADVIADEIIEIFNRGMR